MLSQKAKYALRALAYLARQPAGTRLNIGEIAARQHVPHKFLELILLELRNRGFLQSHRGRNGGYGLALPPDQIFLGDVIRSIDGPLAPIPCASLTAYRRCDDCEDEAVCGIRLVMRQVRDATAKILDDTSLADMVRRTQENPLASGLDTLDFVG